MSMSPVFARRVRSKGNERTRQPIRVSYETADTKKPKHTVLSSKETGKEGGLPVASQRFRVSIDCSEGREWLEMR